jgi:hypothetical protein
LAAHVIYALPPHTHVKGGTNKLGKGGDLKSYGGYIGKGRIATEAALLRLLRVKYRLLGLRPCDQNVDPSDRSLIGAPRCDVEEMRDSAIEFDALVTHY